MIEEILIEYHRNNDRIIIKSYVSYINIMS